MKPETAAIYKNAFNALPSGPLTIEFIRGLTLLAKGYAEVTAPALTAATMDEFLEKMPEPEPEDLPMAVAGISFLPGLIRKGMIQTRQTFALPSRRTKAVDRRLSPLSGYTTLGTKCQCFSVFQQKLWGVNRECELRVT